MSRIRLLIRRCAALAVIMAAALPFVSVQAQDAPPVLILPVDQASFLPGARFDFRVEVHAPTLPENFAVTVNDTPAAEFFGAEPTAENWEFGGDVKRFNNEGAPPADFSLATLAVDYYNTSFGPVAVTLDGDNLSANVGGDVITLEATDNPLVFNAVGGPADGEAVTFGLDADGNLTGFQVLGQDFGVFTRQPTPSNSVIWRDLSAPVPGEYVVEVTAGGTSSSVTWEVREPAAGSARNVILFVADGMTVAMLSAARAARGMTEGLPTNPLSVDSIEVIGLASTSSVDSLMADSANTASSLNTGHIGSVNATGSYSDTSPNALDDPRTETFASMVSRLRGMSVGVVTTSDFSDATPAAVWAHGRNRGDGNRAAYVTQALEGGYIDVLMGGGARRLLPQSVEGSRRSDDRDMFAEYEAAGFSIATTATELSALMGADALPELLLGVFHSSDLNVWLDRNVYTDNVGDFADQPGLVDMTMGAIDVLAGNENGFYLQVEAASIDKQMHPLDAERAISDLIEFDQAVAAARAWAAENAPDTLIVVTADHGHGYDVYGTVDVERFNGAEDDTGRRAAIRVYNAARYPDYPDADGDGQPEWGDASIVFAQAVNNRPDMTEDFQVSPVPRSPAITNDEGIAVDNPDDDPNGILLQGNLDPRNTSGVHTLQDVPVYAEGPGAEVFMGHYHQREIFFGMAAAIGLDPSSADGRVAAAIPEVTTAGLAVPGGMSGLVLVALGALIGFVLSRTRK